MQMQPNSSQKRWLVAVLLFVATLVFFSETFSQTRSWVFQERDLARAEHLVQGRWIWFGPETTGGGHSFGPLYYYLLAVPVLLGSTWVGAWCLMIGLSALSVAIIWLFLSRFASARSAVLAAILFVMSDWHLKMIFAFYNPSYLPVFQIACALLLAYAFMLDKANARAWFLSLFCLGLGSQIHASILTMLPAAIALQILAPRLGLPRLAWGRFAFGFVGFLLPIAPYLIWAAGNGELLGAHSPNGSLADTLVAMKVLVFNTPAVGTMAAPFMAFFSSLLSIPSLLLLLPFLSRLARAEERTARPLQLIKIFAVQAACTYPLVIQYALAANGHRYRGPFALTISILAALMIDRELVSRKLSRIYIVASVALAALLFAVYPAAWLQSISVTMTLIFAALLTGSVYLIDRRWETTALVLCTFVLTVMQSNVVSTFGYTGSGVRSPLGRAAQYLAISETIYHRTGWDFSEARRRMYFINPHVEQSLAYAYRAVRESFSGTVQTTPAPAGFLTTLDAPELNGVNELKAWILKQNVPGDLKRWLESGKLQLETPVKAAKNTFVIPYSFAKDSELPLFIQNVGYPYAKYPGAEILEKNSATGAHFENGCVIFRWNECPGRQRDCTTGAIVRIEGKKPVYTLHITVLGQPLSHLSEWISPRWTEEWNEAFLETECGANKQRFHLPSSLGRGTKFTTREHGNMIIKSNSLLAPYEQQVKLHCAQGLRALSMGRENSVVVDTSKIEAITIKVPTLRAPLKETDLAPNPGARNSGAYKR